MINGGSTHTIGGTSASTPLIASLVSLLNEYRIQNNQSPLGFLNPLIYEMAQAGKGWWDITLGDNHPTKACEGYSCTKGWDAVTGWGTPNFAEILEYVKKLPSGRTLETVV